MKHLKLIAVTVGLILVVNVTAGAVSVPLPPNGLMNVDAWGAFSEIFLEVTDDDNPMNLAVGFHNDLAIGYTLADTDPITPGVQPGHVLYTGASSTVVSLPDTSPPSAVDPTAPGQVLAVGAAAISDAFKGTGDWEGKSRGRLYVGGAIQSISVGTDSVNYNLGPGDTTNPIPQLTFALYHAYVDDMTLGISFDGLTGGSVIETDFVLTGTDENLHFDVWADDTPDASIGDPNGAGKRYAGLSTAGIATPSEVIHELPVRSDTVDTNNVTGGDLLIDLDDGTYYDRFGDGWGELAFAGDPNDDDEVFWSFVGNPESPFFRVRETFDAGEWFIDPVTGIKVFIAGPSGIQVPKAGLVITGQLTPGLSLAPAGKTNSGYGFGNNSLVAGDDYQLTGAFRFGAEDTGAYDSDYNTFTFQQGEPGSVATLTQLKGGLIPEPLTMLGLFLGVGSLAGYIRKRKLA
ncbi:MAG: PEP-CTERM sorting domain-containing protein [Phycisphaerae bacterium]|nr:PEP-CTERM sorting domain-containing protein [Phycisphaerae bacterium]